LFTLKRTKNSAQKLYTLNATTHEGFLWLSTVALFVTSSLSSDDNHEPLPHQYSLCGSSATDVDILWAAVNGEPAATRLMTMTKSLIQTAPSTHVHINLVAIITLMENTSGKLIQIMSIQEASTILCHQLQTLTILFFINQNGGIHQMERILHDIFPNFAEIYSSAMGDG
jgi:hypothetical protein